MKIGSNALGLALLILVSQLQLQAQDEIPEPVKPTHLQFLKAKEKVDFNHDVLVAELKKKYLTALEREKNNAAKGGNLELVVSIDREIKALQGGKKESDEKGDTPPETERHESLERLAATFQNENSRLEALRDQKIAGLIKTYDAQLEKAQTELTKQLKVDEALAVKSLREKLKNDFSFASGNPKETTPKSTGGIGSSTGSSLPRSRPMEKPGRILTWQMNNGQPIVGENRLQAPEGENFVRVWGSSVFLAAIRHDGTIAFKGRNTGLPRGIPDDLGGVVAVAMGWENLSALNQDGVVKTWSLKLDAEIPEIEGAIAIYAKEYIGMALLESQKIAVFGKINPEVKKKLERMRKVVDLAVGAGYALVLLEDGSVEFVGEDNVFSEEERDLIENLGDVVDVVTSGHVKPYNPSAALLTDGRVISWGWNGEFEPPEEVTTDVKKLRLITSGSTRTMICLQKSTGEWKFLANEDDRVVELEAAINGAGVNDISYGLGGGVYAIKP